MRIDKYSPDKPVHFFGGEQGFEMTQKRDNYKRKVLEDENIPLIEIRYDEGNIEKFLLENLTKYKASSILFCMRRTQCSPRYFP